MYWISLYKPDVGPLNIYACRTIHLSIVKMYACMFLSLMCKCCQYVGNNIKKLISRGSPWRLTLYLCQGDWQREHFYKTDQLRHKNYPFPLLLFTNVFLSWPGYCFISHFHSRCTFMKCISKPHPANNNPAFL